MTLDNLAGFFDGEGCISIAYNRRQNRYTLQVSVINTRTPHLNAFVETFGGRIYLNSDGKSGRRRPCFQWVINHHKAADCLRRLLPWLCEKRPEAEIALEFYEFQQNTKFKDRLGRPRGQKDVVRNTRLREYWVKLSELKGPASRRLLNKRANSADPVTGTPSQAASAPALAGVCRD